MMPTGSTDRPKPVGDHVGTPGQIYRERGSTPLAGDLSNVTERAGLPAQPAMDTSKRHPEGQDTPSQPQEHKESLGRPSDELIAAQEASVKHAVAAVQAALKELRNSFERPGSSIADSDRATFQRLAECVNFLCTYLTSKLPILINVNTSEEDRIHIALVISVYSEDAAGGSLDIEEHLRSGTTAKQIEEEAKQAEEKSAILSLIGILQQGLKCLGKEFSKLVCSLLTPREWTLKWTFETGIIIARTGTEVEIKFGR